VSATHRRKGVQGSRRVFNAVSAALHSYSIASSLQGRFRNLVPMTTQRAQPRARANHSWGDRTRTMTTLHQASQVSMG
jgi:hypothetical protein